ncbi:TRAP transporter small permease [Pacificoceanicola onchidii]|uniref:TRAP transporter small permease n=1 Tax=Pacificoceanicola onchidii TaxID=2562685 RepID=UPI0010A64A39|nr:TRAP transporter small permease [Pacificoceanicola onchidii]
MTAIRRVLDTLYLAGGVVAAVFTVLILAIIVAQMVARWTGLTFPGAADYAGYCMAGASFFAFAYALNHGAHIRVSIALNAMGRYRRWGETFCYAVGAAVTTFVARYAWKYMLQSHKFKDVSQGQDATPLWIPQLVMVIGSILLAIAFWDNLVRLLVTGTTNVQDDLTDQSHAE